MADLFKMLVEVVQRGPEAVVAFLFGAAFLGILWFRSHRAGRGRRKRAEQFRLERDVLNEKLAESQRRADRLEATSESDKREIADLHAARLASTEKNHELRESVARLTANVEATREASARLREAHDELVAANETLRDENEESAASSEAAREEVDTLRESLLASQRTELLMKQETADLGEQLDRLTSFDGRVWEKSPISPIPPFQPLAQRRVPVIAVANLKGGVGKTTLTANLGAVLSQDNLRVLLVDLDYQGSLTSLCLSGEDLEEIRRLGRFVDHFFREAAANREAPAGATHRVAQLATTRLMAADESLADEENRLMARWILDPEQCDVRYLLRRFLHSGEVLGEFDYILIDCPPRLTTACVNGLAAADFLLVPVLLDRASTEAVPRQIRALRNLRETACPDLSLLGLVANRVHLRQGKLIQREQHVWEAIPEACEQTLEETVYQFTTWIRDHKAFAEAARGKRFAAADQDVAPIFQDFAQELRTRIAQHERQGSSAVSSKSPKAT